MQDIPSEIRNSQALLDLHKTLATRSIPVVAITGAGLSTDAGIPAWSRLRTLLCESILDGINPESKDELQQAQLTVSRINKTATLWQSFSILRDTLGITEYRARIRAAFEPGDNSPIPKGYENLWHLPIRGMITLNLDSLAFRAFSKTHPGTELKHMVAADSAATARIIHSSKQFLFQPHGKHDVYSSWVFTESDLRSLFDQQAYRDLLWVIYSTCTILFVGISADDFAIGSPLTDLASRGFEGNEHYWITDRDDEAAKTWATAAGVRIVHYDSSKGHGVVSEILQWLAETAAPEVTAPPVLLRTPNTHGTIESPKELIGRDPEELRRILNNHASALIREPNGESLFEKFLDEYDAVIDRAWYVPTRRTEEVVLFGHTLNESTNSGAFGRVFPCQDPGGNILALKLLHREIKDNLPLLQSYRRGVQALQILTEKNLPGIVKFHQASEIPAFITMDWINGPNLAEAKSAHLLDEWEEILWVTSEVARIIKKAHSLPERVLHRDLRPANVMLENGWSDRDLWELYVLDFDLSTYRGAQEQSILAKNSALGYLAPEQTERNSRFSTRSTLVDSFGLGMTLYFLCGGEEPRAFLEGSTLFRQRVRGATLTPKDPGWKSLPRRIERLIFACTQEDQTLRPTMDQIFFEVDRLLHALRGEASDTDLICEEIANQTDTFSDRYTWNEESEYAEYVRADGLRARLQGQLSSEILRLTLDWTATGIEKYSGLRTIPDRLDRAKSTLTKNGWNIDTRSQKSGYFELSCTRSTAAQSLSELTQVASGIDRSIAHLKFQ